MLSDHLFLSENLEHEGCDSEVVTPTLYDRTAHNFRYFLTVFPCHKSALIVIIGY